MWKLGLKQNNTSALTQVKTIKSKKSFPTQDSPQTQERFVKAFCVKEFKVSLDKGLKADFINNQ